MNKKEIEQQIHDLAEKMYQAGYADGNNTNLIDEAYQEGLNDACKCFKRIAYPTCDGGLSADELYDIFRTSHIGHILKNYLPSEVIQKIKDYEEKQKQADAEIRVGDEVCGIKKELRGVVTDICHDGCGYFTANVMMMSGKCASVDLSVLYKTGKHYSQIEEVLKELRRDEE